MEDVYKSINRITKTDACTKAYHEPRYDSISELTTEEVNEVSYNTGKSQYSYDKSHNSSNFRKQYNGSPYNRYWGDSHSYWAPIKVKCYYCNGEHCINECEKFKKDEDKYNLSRANIAKKYNEKLLQNAKKSSISINETALSSKSQESTYSIEQAEQQFIGGMQLSKTNSDSHWLEQVIEDITIEKVNTDNAVLSKVKENITEIEALYNTCASISLISQWFFN